MSGRKAHTQSSTGTSAWDQTGPKTVRLNTTLPDQNSVCSSPECPFRWIHALSAVPQVPTGLAGDFAVFVDQQEGTRQEGKKSDDKAYIAYHGYGCPFRPDVPGECTCSGSACSYCLTESYKIMTELVIFATYTFCPYQPVWPQLTLSCHTGTPCRGPDGYHAVDLPSDDYTQR